MAPGPAAPTPGVTSTERPPWALPSRPPESGGSLTATTALSVLPARRYWLYAVWYVLASLSVAGLWANLHHTSQSALAHTAAYLTYCGAALFLPGLLIEAVAVGGGGGGAPGPPRPAPRPQRSLGSAGA
jgi:hypothetical protein